MKDFIRLNVNDNYLSLGNLFRVIKEESNNVSTFWQPSLFAIIFDTEDVADSTINNYCTGLRAINPKYKEYLVNLKEKSNKDKNVFVSMVANILNLMNNNLNLKTIEQINKNVELKKVCQRLYSISKNDIAIDKEMMTKLYKYLENSDLYLFFVEVLLFVVLERKQPIYINDEVNKIIEESIYDTNISMKDIQEFVKIQLSSWICSMRTMRDLVKNNNPLACFELASMEYYGLIAGKPRYEKAYEYYKIAADYNHPIANWVIGQLYYLGLIGNKSKKDIYLAIKYFNKARKLKCSYSYNSFGLIFLRGDVKHISKNREKAKEFFKKAISLDNVYAYNNLGKIYEDDGELKKAYNCYYDAAKKGESWALNKLGEFYRNGIAVNKDAKKAFEYYQEASEATIYTLCYWSKYNLAKYYYKDGNLECNVKKDVNKAIELLNDIKEHLIVAVEELIYIYYELYLQNGKSQEYYNKLQDYIKVCEEHKSYNEEIGKRINEVLKDIKKEVYKIELP